MVVFVSGTQTSAATESEALSAYQSTFSVQLPALIVPSVIELDLAVLPADVDTFLVQEEETGRLIHHMYEQEEADDEQVDARWEENGQLVPSLTDGNLTTSYTFRIPDDINSGTTLTLTAPRPVTASEIDLTLARNVTVPTIVSLIAVLPSGERLTVIAPRAANDRTITFPETTADTWEITFVHEQLLRISEIELVQEGSPTEIIRSLRFLAQPNMTYRVYADADRPVSADTTEANDLSDRNVVNGRIANLKPNPIYVPADVDGDGVIDQEDNCPNHANESQQDLDDNGIGDTCEDFDRDGVVNDTDNCPNTPNRHQEDSDGDGVGDECDDEESRLTEKYGWLPWVGIGVAAGVILLLFVVVARRPEDTVLEDGENDDSEESV